MYYMLKKQFALRGWEKLNTGIVDLTNGRVSFLPANKYRVLLRCSDRWDSDSFIFTDADRAVLAELEEKGILESFKAQPEPLREEQRYKLYNNRFIERAHWSITGRCNYRCRHCYMSGPTGKLGELSLEECRAIIDDLERCGIFRISITGGEPLVHPHFWEIVKYLGDKHIFITDIYSNGFLINEEFFAKCAQLGIKPQIQLSFDGTDGQHEWLRNVPEAGQHIERALRLCQKYGFRTAVYYCLHRGNSHCLKDSIKYLEGFGIRTLRISPFLVKGVGEGIADYALSYDEMWRVVLDYLAYYKNNPSKLYIVIGGIILNQGEAVIDNCLNVKQECWKDYCVCGHIRNVMHIEASGRVLPCAAITNARKMVDKFPKITEVKLEKILSDSFYLSIAGLTLKEFVEHNRECEACPYLLKCAGGCRGMAASEKDVDSYYAKDERACYFFKQGIYDKVKAILF